MNKTCQRSVQMSFEDMFLGDYEVILRTVIVGLLAYIALVVIVRFSGKRTLSQLNAFDFIVTVALGSILATIILDQNVSLLQGIAAYLILVLMQYVITRLTLISDKFDDLVKSDPKLLYYQDEYLEENLKKERLNKSEIRQAVRASGTANLENVKAVILESEGSISVIPKSDDPSGNEQNDIMKNVKK